MKLFVFVPILFVLLSSCECQAFGEFEPNSVIFDGSTTRFERSKRSPSPCEKGHKYFDGCNQCVCIDGHYACTEKLCLGLPESRPDSSIEAPKPKINEPGFTCVPGESFKNDCNECLCNSAGNLAKCSLKACAPHERVRRGFADEQTTEQTPERCTPGSTKMEKCNRCRCTNSGVWGCTRKACPELNGDGSLNTLRRSKRASDTCRKGDVEMQECNECRCIARSVWVCGVNPCKIKTTQVDFQNAERNVNSPDPAKPAEIGFEEIEQQLLGQILTSASVDETTKPPKRLAPTERRSDSPKTTFGQRMHTGSSEGSSIPITARPKPYTSTSEKVFTQEEFRSPSFECTPSLSFKLDCNTCWCAADGKRARFCTRIACKPKTYKPLDQQR